MRVIFTRRAYCALLTEVAEKPTTETGGLFLGHRVGDTWYIVETIDPGPDSVFEVAYFEYDREYTNFLANKIARLYAEPLKLIGLWHRHPGSFDQFSTTDDGTNKKFAQQNNGHAVSALVNIDPQFRLTVYHVSLPIAYEKINYCVDDDAIPSEFRELKSETRIIEQIETGRKHSSKLSDFNSISLKEVFKCAENEFHPFNSETSDKQTEEVSNDSNLEKVLDALSEDIEFLSERCCDLTLSALENAVICKEITTDDYFEVTATANGDNFVLKYGEKNYVYSCGVIKSAFEKAEKRKLVNKKTNKWSNAICQIWNYIKK